MGLARERSQNPGEVLYLQAKAMAIPANEQKSTCQRLELAHPSKEPFCGKKAICGVGSPEEKSVPVASIPPDPLAESKSRHLELTGTVEPDRKGDKSIRVPTSWGFNKTPHLGPLVGTPDIIPRDDGWFEILPEGSEPFPSRQFAHDVWDRTRHHDLWVRQ
jgi:hypothetical protein